MARDLPNSPIFPTTIFPCTILQAYLWMVKSIIASTGGTVSTYVTVATNMQSDCLLLSIDQLNTNYYYLAWWLSFVNFLA